MQSARHTWPELTDHDATRGQTSGAQLDEALPAATTRSTDKDTDKETQAWRGRQWTEILLHPHTACPIATHRLAGNVQQTGGRGARATSAGLVDLGQQGVRCEVRTRSVAWQTQPIRVSGRETGKGEAPNTGAE
jgi:hypothetical protein